MPLPCNPNDIKSEFTPIDGICTRTGTDRPNPVADAPPAAGPGTAPGPGTIAAGAGTAPRDDSAPGADTNPCAGDGAAIELVDVPADAVALV